MSITEEEREWFDRAKARLAENRQLEGLAQESTYQALAKAEASLASASPELRPGAEAQAALAVAFTYFVAGSAAAVQAAVAAHARDCTAVMLRPRKGNFIVRALEMILTSPIAAAIVVGVLIVKYGDKLSAFFM